MSELDEVFAPGGVLARSLEGYVPRESQRQMAGLVAAALAGRERLLVEAGTGTGKTFAYLVPALLSGLRVLLSTGTRNLQDQLYNRDIPLLAGALGRPVRMALLKGRSNYLCRWQLQLNTSQGSLLPGGEHAELRAINEWAASTRSGDLAELPQLGESHPLRAQLTSTRESCTGQRCSEFARCHVFAARRAALEAELVVVNHHLLLADLALKEDGFGELLPGVDALILDEAHQLPDLAAEFFGISCSSRQVELLLHDARRELALLAVPAGALATTLAGVEQPLHELLALLGRQERRLAWEDAGEAVYEACTQLREALQAWSGHIEQLAEGPGVTQCAQRARGIALALEQVAVPPDEARAELEGVAEAARERVGLAAEAGAGAQALGEAMLAASQEAEGSGARSLAVTPRGFTLGLLPYDISARFRRLMDQHPAAWVFTSATLALAGDFRHFSARLGMTAAPTLCLESPFDYARQALLYLPEGLPDPSSPLHTEALLASVRPLLDAAGGGAFLLFTSHRALRVAAQLLRAGQWPAGWPLLVQNEAPRELLLRRFRESGRAVLLGTASFWEGVDVQGAALRLVVIDKLPFASPDDPQVRARVRHLQALGANAFRDYQLPEAALALKQGVGRLVRSEQDRGVVVIGDPRLTTKGYGRSLLAVLPPMRRVRSPDEPLVLLRECAAGLPPLRFAALAGSA
jgi:ATP-dependent DNA helicase DinG